MKEAYTFRYDSQKLNDLLSACGVTGDYSQQRMERLLDFLYEKLILYKKSQTEPSEQKPLDEELTCKLRILSDKGYYCVTKPPKVTKLLSLDVCKVCLALFRGLTDHTKRLGAQVDQSRKAEPTLTPTVSSSDVLNLRLAKGELSKWCSIDKHAYPLFQLPCVKNTETPETKTGCRYSDCENSVRKALALHLQLSRRPSG